MTELVPPWRPMSEAPRDGSIICAIYEDLSGTCEVFWGEYRDEPDKQAWFMFVDEVPGLGVLGANYEASLDRLKVEAGKLFRARGETVSDIEIVRSEQPVLQVFH